MKFAFGCAVLAFVLGGCAGTGGGPDPADVMVVDQAAKAESPESASSATAVDRPPRGPAGPQAGISDLVLAASFGQEETVRALLAQGVDVNGRDALGRTALIAAAGESQAAILRLLIGRGADLTLRDGEGTDALMIAVIKGRKDNVRLLLEAGANLEARSPAGETALMAAIRAGQIEMVDDLLARGADANVYTQDEILARNGYTPLMYAARYGSGAEGLGIMRRLIGRGAAAGIRRPNGETALTIAQRNGQQEMLEALAKFGARDESPYAGMSAGDGMVKAIRLDDVAKVRELLAGAVDPNFRNSLTGVTPLASASFYGRREAMALLIEHGAQVNDVPWGLKEDRIAASSVPVAQRDLLRTVARGDTALITSVRRDDVAMVKLVLEHGAQVMQPNRAGDTPGVLAVRAGNAAIVRELLRHGLNPDLTSFPPHINYLLTRVARGEGIPPLLIEAVHTGRQEVAEALLEGGANPDIQDAQGRTPLYWAAAGDHADMVRLLMVHKANAEIRDRFGASARDIALMNGHQQVAVLISASPD